MKTIKIVTMTDELDCDSCGISYAYGYHIVVDDEIVVEKTPYAHCYDGADYSGSEHNPYFDLLNILIERTGDTFPNFLNYSSFVDNFDKFKMLLVKWIRDEGMEFHEESEDRNFEPY